MSIFLLILKIIGIVLLSLLGLVLFVVLLVLFCPFSYHVKGVCQRKQTDVRANISWLLGLLAVCMNITGDGTKSYLRICGIRFSSSNKRYHFRDFEDTNGKESHADRQELAEPKPLEAQELSKDDFKERNLENGLETAGDTKTDSAISPDTQTDADTDTAGSSVFVRIRERWQNFRKVTGDLKEMFTHFKETCGKTASLWQEENCQAGIKFIVKQLFSLLGKIKPGKFRLKLSFSTGSPDTTGELLGVLSMFSMVYRYHWEVMPDFSSEEAYADAVFDISGRLFGFQILRTGLAIVLDKNCKKLYNKLMK